MLEESLRPQQVTNRVRMGIGQPGLKALLQIILYEWHYQPCDEAIDGGVLLAEEGAIEPPPHNRPSGSERQPGLPECACNFPWT